MLVLAIESSCDETSIALVQVSKPINGLVLDFRADSFKVLSHKIHSQIEIQTKYGGVVPELGARGHADIAHELLSEVLDVAQRPLQDIDLVAVTTTPGLGVALKVGVETAKSLKYYINKESGKNIELIEVNHLQGHVLSCFYDRQIDDSLFPHLHLLVSGGNTQIIKLDYSNNSFSFDIIGATLDDSAGESMDKMGRMLGLPYPAGMWINRIAGDIEHNALSLPVGMKHKPGYSMSYSGLKTAMRYKIRDAQDIEYEEPLTEQEIEKLLEDDKNFENFKLQFIYDACTSIQSVVFEQLMNKYRKALKEGRYNSIGLSGGVSASSVLRNNFENLSGYDSSSRFIAPRELTGDNAVMIAMRAVSMI